MSSPLLHTLIADLLRSLEQEGITLGTGQHLKVQELWRRLPEDIDPQRLKTILVPLFATNPQEQERFYIIFDKSWKRVQDLTKVEEVQAEPPLEEEVAEKNWRWLLYVASILFLGALTWILFRTNTAFQPVNNFHEVPLNIYRGDTLVQDPILRREENDTLRQLAFLDGELYAVDSIWGEYEIDSFNRVIIRAGDTIGRHVDTLVLRVLYNTGLDSIHFVLNLLEKRQSPLPEKVVKPEKKAPRLKTKEIPYKHDLPIPDQAALQKEAYWKKNSWWIKGSLILLLGLLLFIFAHWLERRRKKAVAHLQRAHNGPPYAWTVDLDEPEELAVGQQAKQLTNRLRRRQLEDYLRIDIPATVRATAKHAGQVHFQYRQPSKPSEYLLLIDRNAMQDHRALLYDNLYESFKQEEVHIDRFFYDVTPQIVFNEKYPGGVSLKELQHRFSESRLLIIGDGQSFFNPVDGEWAGWTEELNNWKARGLLSTKPLDKWSYDEDLLAQRFFLLPATLQGVDRLIEQFELVDPKPWEEVVKQVGDANSKSIVFREDLMTTLKQHFSPLMLQWIAASAVYPQLQWKLTLHLGKELSSEEENLLTVENILNMVRLPWFVEGKIPDPARHVLIDHLKEKDLETKVRETIKVLLDKAPRPSQDSVAYEKWRVNQLFNEIQVIAPSPKRRQLKRELENYIEAGYQPDQVTLQTLERQKVPEAAMELSDRWKELLFREGDGLLGWKNWIWAAPIWLVLSGLVLWYNPNYQACKGKIVEYEGQQLCIENDGDQIIYTDHLSRKLIRESERLGGYEKTKVAIFSLENLSAEAINNQSQQGQRSFESEQELTDTIGGILRSLFENVDHFEVQTISFSFEEDSPGRLQNQYEYANDLDVDLVVSGNTRQINGEFQVSISVFDERSGRETTHQMISGVGPTFQSFIQDSILQKYILIPIVLVNRMIPVTFYQYDQFDVYATFLSSKFEANYILPPTSSENYPLGNLLESLFYPNSTQKFFPFGTKEQLNEDNFNVTVEDQFENYVPYLPSRLNDPKELKDVMINPLQEALNIFNENPTDDRPRSLGDQYIENLATALYNKGVQHFNHYLDLKEGVATDSLLSAEDLLDESAYCLLLARDLGTPQPEIYTALLRVYGENEAIIYPSQLRGQITDVYDQPIANVQVGLEGVYDVLTDDQGQYTINLPESWDNNILTFSFFKPGYRVEKITHILVDETSSQVRRLVMTEIPRDQEDQLVIFSDPSNRRQGVRTRDGEIIIPANYARIEKDTETGYYRVETPATRIGSKFGYYDQRGQIVAPAIYAYLDFYTDGLAVAREEDGFFGYLNVQGSKAFPFNFTEAEPFAGGRAEIALENEATGETLQFYIGKDGKCVEGEYCPYSNIVENYIRTVCDIRGLANFEKTVLSQEKPGDILTVLLTDFMRLYYPAEILEEANSCVPDVELYVNGYIVQLYTLAVLADRLPEITKGEAGDLLRTLEDDPETRSRMISKNPNVEKWITTLENALGLNEQQTFTDPNPIGALSTYRQGQKILSVYFDLDEPYGKIANFDLERSSQSYLNKLRAQNATASEGLPFQVDRLNSLADQLYSELGPRYGHTIELIAYADSEEGANQSLLQRRVDAVYDYLLSHKNGQLRPYVSNSGVIIIDKNTKQGLPGPRTNQSTSYTYSTGAINNRRVDIIFRKRTQHQQIQRPRQGNSGTQQQGDAANEPTDNVLSIRDRDGNTYPTKVMADGKRWMTKNLNVKVDSSWCYENKEANCAKYGRLYTWETAKEACRLLGDGWKLPTDGEWQEMAGNYAGVNIDFDYGSKTAYEALLGNGSSGFAAQIGGWRNTGGSFYGLGALGHYWSSTPRGVSSSWYYYFGRDDGQLYRYYYNRGNGHSVRCIQDD